MSATLVGLDSGDRCSIPPEEVFGVEVIPFLNTTVASDLIVIPNALQLLYLDEGFHSFVTDESVGLF